MIFNSHFGSGYESGLDPVQSGLWIWFRIVNIHLEPGRQKRRQMRISCCVLLDVLDASAAWKTFMESKE
jgi:hypothetical protein